jgi:predicted Holliday junction resolvase-like endonuclease
LAFVLLGLIKRERAAVAAKERERERERKGERERERERELDIERDALSKSNISIAGHNLEATLLPLLLLLLFRPCLLPPAALMLVFLHA